MPDNETMGKTSSKVWLVIPDLHFGFNDPKYCNLILKILKILAKDKRFAGIINLGDFVDFWQISSYDKDPSRTETIHDDLMKYYVFLDKICEIMPANTEFHALEGNHEKRLHKYIAKHAPAVHQMVRSIPEVLDFKSRSKNGQWFIWHPYDKWNSCKIGRTIFHHGFYFSEHVAMKNLKTYPFNFVCGHTHRVQYVSDGTKFSCSLGHGSLPLKTMHLPIPSVWQQAVGVFYEGAHFDSLDPILVSEGRCFFMGEYLEAS